MRIAGGFFFVLFLAAGLGGCMHDTGPCYGVGCRAFAPSSAQSQATSGQSNAGSATKPQHADSFLKKIKL